MAGKIFNSRNLMIAVSVLLVAALVTGLVLVTAPEKDNAKGSINAESVVPGGSVNYSPETEGAFRRYVSEFLEIMTESMMDRLFSDTKPHDVTFRNSSAVSNIVINIFSRAAIPSEKLLKFGKMLAETDGEKASEDILLFFLEIEEVTDDEGNTVYQAKFASPAKLMTAFTGGIDFGYAIESTISATALTNEEFARIFYETVYQFSDAERRELLVRTGRERFVNIFVAISAIYESYVTFSVKGGTLAAARTAAELAYETGAELTDLIAEVGSDTVLAALGFGGERFDNEELIEFLVSAGIDPAELSGAEAVNDVLTSGGKAAEFLLHASASALTATDNALFESLARANDATDPTEKENWKYLNYIRLSFAAATGIDAGHAASELTDADKLAVTLAELKVCMEALDTPFEDNSAREKRKAELTAMYVEYVNTVVGIRDRFGSIADIDGVRALSAEDRALVAESARYLENFDYDSLIAGGDNFIGTVAINAVFNLISDMLKEASLSGGNVG